MSYTTVKSNKKPIESHKGNLFLTADVKIRVSKPRTGLIDYKKDLETLSAHIARNSTTDNAGSIARILAQLVDCMEETWGPKN